VEALQFGDNQVNGAGDRAEMPFDPVVGMQLPFRCTTGHPVDGCVAAAPIGSVGAVPPEHQTDVRLDAPTSIAMSSRAWLGLDWLVAVAGLVAAISELRAPGGVRGPAVFVLAFFASAPIGLRRRRPVPVFAAVAASSAALVALGRPCWSLAVLVGLAGYTATLRTGRRQLVLVLLGATALLGAAIGAAVLRGDFATRDIANVVALGVAGAVGENVSVRRRYTTSVAAHERAEADQHAQLVVQSERMRIARELHDGVAHALAVITVQAGAAHRLLGQRPEDVAGALSSIEATGRAAQDELDVVLALLRGSSQAGDLGPVPGIADIEHLVGSVRGSGTPVALCTGGIDGSLPAALQLSIFRIVQEALTNVVKHAPGARASVDLSVSATEVRIEVGNTGPSSDAAHLAPARRGQGIAGMAERAGALGGSLSAEPCAAGGFRVSARIPLRQAS
jgi:signal transduction histidine kinase